MAKEKEVQQDFDLGFSPEEFEQLTANQGLGFTRVKYGDYTLEIVETAVQVAKGKTPHNMLKMTARVVAAVDPANKSEIGSSISNLYAGSPQSPPFMKQRLKALCIATGVSPSKQGGLKGSHFVGKRFDASVVWELSKSDKLDEMGRPKMYVNDRLKGERKVGEERPTGLNPTAESTKAEKYLADGNSSDAGGDRPEWERAATDAPAETGTGFVDESEVDALGHAYRALYKLGGENSEQAKQTLIEAGYDPEGPIKVGLIEDADVRKEYEAKFGGKPNGKVGLPALGKPRTGTRAPAAQ